MNNKTHIVPFVIDGHVALPSVELAKSAGLEVITQFETYVIARKPKQGIKELKPAHTLDPKAESEKNLAANQAQYSSANPDKPATGPEAILGQIIRLIDQLDKAGESLFVGRIAERALEVLLVKAKSGDGEALYRFALTVVHAAEDLSEITKANPKSIQPLAAKRLRWPLMCSHHRYITEAPGIDPNQLLRAIKLGSELPVNLLRRSSWKLDRAGEVALKLLLHLDIMWQVNPLLRYRGQEKLRRARAVLSPISKETSVKWWPLARRLLLFSYPKPQEVSELLEICTADCRRKSPGRTKESIISKIRARFLAIATTSPQLTRDS